jgi:hypothetical protein
VLVPRKPTWEPMREYSREEVDKVSFVRCEDEQKEAKGAAGEKWMPRKKWMQIPGLVDIQRRRYLCSRSRRNLRNDYRRS